MENHSNDRTAREAAIRLLQTSGWAGFEKDPQFEEHVTELIRVEVVTLKEEAC